MGASPYPPHSLDLPTSSWPLEKLAYLHDKGSPTVTFTSVPSFPFIGLVTLRENSGTQEHSSYSSYSPSRHWRVSTGCLLVILVVCAPHTSHPLANLVSSLFTYPKPKHFSPLLPLVASPTPLPRTTSFPSSTFARLHSPPVRQKILKK